MSQMKQKRLLLVGAAGGISEILVPSLKEEYELFGIDSRDYHGVDPFPGQFLRVGYTKRKLTEVFKATSFDALVHVGRISSMDEMSRKSRLEQNVYGTANLLRLAASHGIKKVVVLGTHLVYGAARDIPLYLRENDPLRASEGYGELFDAIELDLETRAFIFEHRNVQTVLLRPVHILGKYCQFALNTTIQKKFFPMLLGFDPLIQIIDERDVVRALLICLKESLFGVFNLAGEGVIPLSRAIELVGIPKIFIPPWAISPVSKVMRVGGQKFPQHLVNYIKYPTIISDKRFKESVHWQPQYQVIQTLEELHKLLQHKRVAPNFLRKESAR